METTQRTLQTLCECQAKLGATLDEAGQVLTAWAVHGYRLTAPALSPSSAGLKFDLVWKCPFCDRNTLRSFQRDG